MRRVGKGFSGVETPLFEGMLAAREIEEEGIAEEQVQADDAVAAAVQETVAEDVANEAIPSTPTPLILPSPPSYDLPSTYQETAAEDVANEAIPSTPTPLILPLPPSRDIPSTSQKLEIIKLKARVKRLERANKGRMIDDLDKDEGIELAEIYHLDLDHPSKVLSMQEDDSEVQEVVEVVTTAKLITEVVTAATSQVSTASATISAAKPSIPAATPIVVAAYTRRRKRNTDGYKLDFLKEMSYDEIRPIFQARFNANMRFLLKSREKIEEEDRE
nr:hypothetical protein [Tanacetum cinerariifolium]